MAMDARLVSIQDLAMRRPSPAPQIDRILTGHEHRRRDRCWRPDGTEDWLLIHTRSGQARIALPDGDRLVGPGEAIIYRPGAPQDFGSDGSAAPWELVWAHFEPFPHWLELLRWPELATGILHMKVSDTSLLERVEGLLLETDRLSASGLPRADRLALNALEAALLWWDLQNPRVRQPDPRVVRAIDYLSHHLRRRVSLDELARVVHLSPSRFAHVFKQETGLTARRFVERQRIERAKQLLELTSLPVNAVAREVGFDSQFYFATRFKRLTGLTPSAYRASRWGVVRLVP